jgi:hypothetical protein
MVFKGTVSRKLAPMLLYINRLVFLSGFRRKRFVFIFIKGPVFKIHKKFIALSDHFNGKSH